MEVIGVLVLMAGAVAFFLPLGVSIAMVILFALLQSAGAIVIPGSASIQPGHLMLALMLVRVACDVKWRVAFRSVFRVASPGFWLLLTSIYAVLGAFFLPRIWSSGIEVYTLGATLDFITVPLSPANTNLTQSIYIFADLAWFLILYHFIGEEMNAKILIKALLCFGVLNIAFAFIDMFTAATSTGYLLGFIRNAAYSIYDNDVIGGSKRIVGSFTEASAFASTSVGIFCFAARLWLGGAFVRLSAPISVVTLVLILVSTSSTGLLALPIGVSILYAGAAVRLTRGKASGADTIFVAVFPCLVLALATFVFIKEDWLEWVQSQANLLLFDKSTTESGVERAAINRDAWRVFLETYGLGAGLGSVRASSFVMACLACLGAPGTCLFLLFMAKLFRPEQSRLNGPRATIGTAGRYGCFGLLIPSCVSGLHTDLGLLFFAFAALSFAPEGVARLQTMSLRRVDDGRIPRLYPLAAGPHMFPSPLRRA